MIHAVLLLNFNAQAFSEPGLAGPFFDTIAPER